MTDLASGSTSIQNFLTRLGYYKGSPIRMQQVTYGFFDEVMQGKVSLVDPTNPFILLTEMSCLHAATAVNESLINTRRSSPGLAQTDQDIYRHLTDTEYIGGFATPGSVPITFMFDLNSLINSLQDASLATVPDELRENCFKGIIPRDTVITVDTYTFTLEYPIVFRKFTNGVLQIAYDTTVLSPISTPSNNIISGKVRVDSSGVKWMYFTIPVKQMAIGTNTAGIQQESVFNKDFAFDDQFVYARVFNKKDTDGDWVEMRTTHSDQVFDNDVPTAVLSTFTNSLNVTIPFIYNTLELVSGQIRVDIYTTKGDVSVNMGSYTMDAFMVTMRAIDTIRDINEFTNIWGKVTNYAFSTAILTGGTNGITFDALKQKVTNYAFGAAEVPITGAQRDEMASENGFTVVALSDTLTSREFLGIRAIPDITVTDTMSNTQKLLSRANVGVIRLNSSLEDLERSDNVVTSPNGNRATMLSNTVFQLVNGVASVVESADVQAIKALAINNLVNSVNTSQYVYSPYYYVFDSDSELLPVRPYDLDHPDADNQTFIRQNTTLAMPVNTGSYNIEQIPGGFRLTIVTVSGQTYKAPTTDDSKVGVQLRLTNTDGSLWGTINGVLTGTDSSTGERIYQFDIHTSYDVDAEHNIEITNAYKGDGIIQSFFAKLDLVVDVLWTTSFALPVDYVPDETDQLVNKSTLPTGSVGNTHEQLEITFGIYLEHLWKRSRSFATGLTYQTATVDIPDRYTQDVYETNPVTGSIIFFDGPGGAANFHKLYSLGDLNLKLDDAAGVRLFMGDGVPASSLGIDGDFYRNVANNAFYGPKVAGAWPGTTHHLVVKSVAPVPSDGLNGDYFLNAGTGDFYGPKSGGTWPPSIIRTFPAVLKYRKGDNILDNSGNPIQIGNLTAMNDFDILVIDGKLEFVTDNVYIDYKNKIVGTLTQWITQDILVVQDRLMPRTTIYFYPEASLGVTKIVEGISSAIIDSEQSPTVTIYADESVINDPEVQASITNIVCRYLDTAIRQLKFSVDTFQEELRPQLGTTVSGVSITGIGGDTNYRTITVSDEHNRLCIKRKLVSQADNTIIVDYSVNVVFKPY